MATRQPRNRYLVCIFMLYFSRWAKGKLLEWTKPNKMRAALNRLYAKESLWCLASPKNVRVLSALQYIVYQKADHIKGVWWAEKDATCCRRNERWLNTNWLFAHGAWLSVFVCVWQSGRRRVRGRKGGGAQTACTIDLLCSDWMADLVRSVITFGEPWSGRHFDVVV